MSENLSNPQSTNKYNQNKLFLIIPIFILLVISIFILFSPKKNDSQTIIQKFKNQKLELGEVNRMEVKDFGLAPKLTEDAYRFIVPSICEASDCGGRIFGFGNKSDLEKTNTYYNKLGESSALFFSHTCNNDQYLIQINGEMKKDVADKYCSVLK